MKRRDFITIAGMIGIGLTSGANETVLNDPMSEQLAESFPFIIKLLLPENMDFEAYKLTRDKKLNYQLFIEIENSYIKTGKIKSKEFLFSGKEAQLIYQFGSEQTRSEFSKYLKSNFDIGNRFVAKNQIEVKIERA